MGQGGADGGDGREASIQVLLQICGFVHPRPKRLGSYSNRGNIGHVRASSPAERHQGDTQASRYPFASPL